MAESTQLFGVVLDQTGEVMEMSNSKTYLNGEKNNINSKQELVLEELNNELAELLVLYAKAGGKITGVTTSAVSNNWKTNHFIILPAVKSGTIYSLQPARGINVPENSRE